MGIGSGTTALKAYISEYGIIDNGDEPLLVFDTDVDGSTVKLRCSSPVGATNIQVVYNERKKGSNPDHNF